MTDDIIRKATTADYIETIDNLRAEVERLRAALAHELDLRNRHIESLEARIKELEAEAQEYHDKKEEALTLCAGQNRYIERLEADFLESEAYAHACMGESMPVNEEDLQAAREALERIKAETGSGDHVAGANKLILTAEQREEEGKRDA